jgi:hypothetical protein
MSFLGGLLDVVGAAVAIVSGPAGWGLLAGALLGVAAASQFGIIGGSIGKFMTSGWGTALAGAVSMGAVAMYGQSALQAGQAAMGTTTQTAADASGGAVAAAGAPGQAAAETAVATPSALGDAAGTSQNMAGMATTETTMLNAGVPAESVAAMNPATASEALATPNLGAQSVQAAGNATSADTAAVGTMGNTGGAPAAGAANADQSAVGTINPAQQSSALATPNMPPAANTMPASPVSTLQPTTPSAAMGGPTSAGGSTAGQSGSGLGGMLSKAASGIEAHPALAQVGGSLVNSLGQGISQNAQIQAMIQAQEWGNLQWQNQSQVDQLQAAAAKPITVPTGYLQRAQQVRGLMAGGAGIQPGAPMGPGGALAPPPTPPTLQAPSVPGRI